MSSRDKILNLLNKKSFSEFLPLFQVSDIKNILLSGVAPFLLDNKVVNIGFKENNDNNIIISKYDFIKLISHALAKNLKDFCLNSRKSSLITDKNKPFSRFFIIIVFIYVILYPCVKYKFIKLILVKIIALYIMCRLLFLIYAVFYSENKKRELIKDNIATIQKPVYSIIIALYKENKIISQLIDALSKFNYPKDKLDVLLALEEDDFITKKAIDTLNLPDYITVINVPYFEPRTKPKALNYAINYAKGDYITIYDAEDIMDPDQLNIALEKFAENPKFGALQGILLFYNFKQNIVTKLFYFEYWTWFQFTMYSIANIAQYIPLGGSTNHFKREALFKIGCWDAYNVTEDLEISLRLFGSGYSLGLINSITEEQCVYTLKSWLKQRIRWQKGYFITYLSYFKSSFKNFNLIYFLIFHTIVGFSWIVFLITPILFFSFDFASSIIYFVYIFILASMVLFLNFKFMLFNLNSISQILLFFPVYFVMHSIASYLMIFDAIFRPSYWSKTNHDTVKNTIDA